MVAMVPTAALVASTSRRWVNPADTRWARTAKPANLVARRRSVEIACVLIDAAKARARGATYRTAGHAVETCGDTPTGRPLSLSAPLPEPDPVVRTLVVW